MGALEIELKRYVEQGLRERVEQLHARLDATKDDLDVQVRRARSAERQRDGWREQYEELFRLAVQRIDALELERERLGLKPLYLPTAPLPVFGPVRRFFARLLLPTAFFVLVVLTGCGGQAWHESPSLCRLPLNGGFETQLDPAEPPDFWFLPPGEGAFGTQVTIGTDALEGAHHVVLKTTDATARATIFGTEFSVNESDYYAASCWRKCVSGSGNNVVLRIQYYDADHHAGGFNAIAIPLTDSVGTWVKTETASELPPAGSRFGRIIVELSGGVAGREVHVDSVNFDVGCPKPHAGEAQ